MTALEHSHIWRHNRQHKLHKSNTHNPWGNHSEKPTTYLQIKIKASYGESASFVECQSKSAVYDLRDEGRSDRGVIPSNSIQQRL